jgi:monoterpene epsilon-lactone hydrolase
MNNSSRQVDGRRRPPQTMGRILSAFALAMTVSAGTGGAWAQVAPPREVPSRTLPVPGTLSPELQRVIGRTPGPHPRIPGTLEEWRALVNSPPTPDFELWFTGFCAKFGVAVAPQVIGGVPCFVVTPRAVKPNYRNRLLLGLHHGGWVGGGGEGGLTEAVVISGLLGSKVISVDYRLLPDHPFPAAMDDAMAVWREAAKLARPANIGVFGSSVGGGMVLSLVQRAIREGLPLPGAVVSGSPWSDLSKTGDSYFANDGVDGGIAYDGFWEAVAKLYAGGRDLRDPLLSPVYGDFLGFPPTYLVTGTRDLFLSNTVRVHQRLLMAGVPAQLEVEEGQSHMNYLEAATRGAPEGAELYSHIARFFDEHLGR